VQKYLEFIIILHTFALEISNNPVILGFEVFLFIIVLFG
jgi:hypothetical protein